MPCAPSSGSPEPMAAVQSAIDQKETIPLSQILTVTNVSSATATVTLGEWGWASDSYAIPLKDRYYVHGRVWIGNGIGCTITANSSCQISIMTNKTVFSSIIYPFISGCIGVVPIYGNELSDFWFKNLNDNITWNNTYKLRVTFSGWVNR